MRSAVGLGLDGTSDCLFKELCDPTIKTMNVIELVKGIDTKK
jgi:hypothetical protein